ncbi:MAG: phosphohistidine phosphatase SixA [Acidobacteria bacterium]|nr:phosphohistidine phosphatase SixA [Acidobacteriota bacterium]MDA1235683.1 phosphohistidine phosphatase SixA [Acidobacteriota bacterium]
MDVFVLRHAIAEDAGAGQADSERRLTDLGRERLRLVVQKAMRAGMAPAVVLTSPYVRAHQTAEILLEELDHPCELVTTSNLTPYAAVADLWQELREYSRLSPLIVVGHNPQLSELVSVLIGSPRYAVEIKKAAIAYVQDAGNGPRPTGRLVWMLTAKLAEA